MSREFTIIKRFELVLHNEDWEEDKVLGEFTDLQAAKDEAHKFEFKDLPTDWYTLAVLEYTTYVYEKDYEGYKRPDETNPFPKTHEIKSAYID